MRRRRDFAKMGAAFAFGLTAFAAAVPFAVPAKEYLDNTIRVAAANSSELVRKAGATPKKAVVSVGAELGKFVIVNARAGVGHDSKLGDFSQVCPGVTLSGHTTVGEHAFLASNSCTVPGVVIGARAKVAAGMPVYANLKEDATLSPFGVFAKA